MSCIIFKTEGLLDLKSITTFGINVKPKTENPIGYFGTGLKYAIAVLMRNRIPVKLFIGPEEYEFFVKDIEFREKGFGQVMYRKRKSIVRRWSYHTLPFTTELGKNWELWQAFRELESNTRDEQGQSYHDTAPLEMHIGEEGYTKWVIGGKFVDVFFERDKIFLPKLPVRMIHNGIQVFNQPSNHLYYRGLRVADLELPSMYTYNLMQEQQLTEDRTLKYMWSANIAIAGLVATSNDPQFVASILSAPEDKFYESKLDFESVWLSPSETFMQIAAKKDARKSMLPRAVTYYSRYKPAQPPKAKPPASSPLVERIQWWLDSGEIDRYPELCDLLRDEVIPALSAKIAPSPNLL